MIITMGDIGRELFLLCSGIVHVEGDHGQLFSILRKGQYFGELGLLFPIQRTASARAITFCDIFCLR